MVHRFSPFSIEKPLVCSSPIFPACCVIVTKPSRESETPTLRRKELCVRVSSVNEESGCRPDDFLDEYLDRWVLALTAAISDVDFAANLWRQLNPCHTCWRA